MNTIKTFVTALFLLGSAYLVAQNKPVEVISTSNAPMVEFGVAELFSSLEESGFEVSEAVYSQRRTGKDQTAILFCLSDDPLIDKLSLDKESWASLKPEGFFIENELNGRDIILVGASDAAGLMYGGLELAELISSKGITKISGFRKEPYMKMRGTKFNIPLDVRTPSYSDVSDAAQNNIEQMNRITINLHALQNNIEQMWSMEFWKEFIEHMARYRYNFISLWSMHPFPSLVKVPEYPDIALEDVHQSTVDWKEHYSLNGWGFDSPEIIDNYRVVKKLTIDQKIEFWREVMRYGKSRNIDFYVVTWNIFT